jgi:hypothetical protein
MAARSGRMTACEVGSGTCAIGMMVRPEKARSDKQ